VAQAMVTWVCFHGMGWMDGWDVEPSLLLTCAGRGYRGMVGRRAPPPVSPQPQPHELMRSSEDLKCAAAVLQLLTQQVLARASASASAAAFSLNAMKSRPEVRSHSFHVPAVSQSIHSLHCAVHAHCSWRIPKRPSHQRSCYSAPCLLWTLLGEVCTCSVHSLVSVSRLPTHAPAWNASSCLSFPTLQGLLLHMLMRVILV
jgi:hypothetical protein